MNDSLSRRSTPRFPDDVLISLAVSCLSVFSPNTPLVAMPIPVKDASASVCHAGFNPAIPCPYSRPRSLPRRSLSHAVLVWVLIFAIPMALFIQALARFSPPERGVTSSSVSVRGTVNHEPVRTVPQAPQVQGMGFRSKTAPAYFEKTVFRLSPEQVMVLRDSFDDELAKLKARGLRSEDVLHLHVEGSANYVSAPDAIVAEYDGPAISGVNVLHADGSKRVHSYAVGAKLTNIDLAVLRAHAAYQAVQNMLPLGMKVGVSYSAREFATENPELRMAQVTISARSE